MGRPRSTKCIFPDRSSVHGVYSTPSPASKLPPPTKGGSCTLYSTQLSRVHFPLLQKKAADTLAALTEAKRRQLELSHRVLRVLVRYGNVITLHSFHSLLYSLLSSPSTVHSPHPPHSSLTTSPDRRVPGRSASPSLSRRKSLGASWRICRFKTLYNV